MLEFSEERHEYRLDGKIVPSVTQVLAPLYSFDRVPPEVLEHKRQIGHAVHKAVELDIQGELDEASLADAVRPYFDAWRLFRSIVRWEDFQTELRVAHTSNRYAGTVDLILRVGEQWWLIDVKSCATVSPAVGLQTAAYARAYETTFPECRIGKRFALQLKANSKPCVTEYRDLNDYTVFQSLLNVHHWRAQHGC